MCKEGWRGKEEKQGEARNLLCSHMGSGYIGNFLLKKGPIFSDMVTVWCSRCCLSVAIFSTCRTSVVQTSRPHRSPSLSTWCMSTSRSTALLLQVAKTL